MANLLRSCITEAAHLLAAVRGWHGDSCEVWIAAAVAILVIVDRFEYEYYCSKTCCVNRAYSVSVDIGCSECAGYSIRQLNTAYTHSKHANSAFIGCM